MIRLASICAVLVASVFVSTESAQARPGGPAPAEPGPFTVGLVTTTMTDTARNGRTLPVDIWYPVDADDTAGVANAELDLLLATLGLDDVLDAPAPADGEFPLVVFSHGSGGVRYQSYFLLQALASHGFVVAAPDHVGNTAIDAIFGTSDPRAIVARNRPRDVSFVIDQMLAQNADRTDPVAPLVDGDRIAVAGHSFGGFTALASAGGFGDYEADPRVDAIVPLAAAAVLSNEEIAAIDVPTMLVSGTADITVPVAGSTERIWANLAARQAYRVDILDAGHNSFTNACDLEQAFVDAGAPAQILAFLAAASAEACAPELIPIDDAHRIITSYTVAFLHETIGSHGFNRYLTPSYPRRAGFDVDYSRSLGRAPARS